MVELKEIEYSWLRPHTNLSSSSLNKVGLLQFGWLGCRNYQHDDSLGPHASTYLISTLFPPRYDMGRLIDGKFRGVAAKIGDFISIAMFRGGWRQILLIADSKYQHWYWMTINDNYSMGRASNNGSWYTWAPSVLTEGRLYRHGK